MIEPSRSRSVWPSGSLMLSPRFDLYPSGNDISGQIGEGTVSCKGHGAQPQECLVDVDVELFGHHAGCVVHDRTVRPWLRRFRTEADARYLGCADLLVDRDRGQAGEHERVLNLFLAERPGRTGVEVERADGDTARDQRKGERSEHTVVERGGDEGRPTFEGLRR